MMYFWHQQISLIHRDDDRATQERVYRMGVNLKFGGGDSSKTTAIGKTKDGTNVNATGANVANGEAVNAESGDKMYLM